jgi:type IV pilus assembly protein PilF
VSRGSRGVSFWNLPLLMVVALLALLSGCQQSAPLRTDDDRSDSPARANLELGAAYLRKGNLERALARLRRALEQDPQLPEVHNVLALAYSQLNEEQAAERHFRRAVELDPRSSTIQNNYGQYLCQRGRYDEALDAFSRALENPLYRTPAYALANRGICARSAGRLDVAETSLRKALEIEPAFPVALLEMAHVSFALGRNLQARAFLQRLASVARHNAETLWLGYRIEQALGDLMVATELAERLRYQFPESEEAQQLMRIESHER